MKVSTFYCDLCGRAIWADEWYKAYTMRATKKGLVSGSNCLLVEDICTDCIKKLEETIVNMQAANKGNTKIDMDKLKALYNAGWSVPRIAEELKITTQSVYYHLKKEKKKHELQENS